MKITLDGYETSLSGIRENLVLRVTKNSMGYKVVVGDFRQRGVIVKENMRKEEAQNIVDAFELANHYMSFKVNENYPLDESIRFCSHCGKEMTQGYVVNAGDEYYCSDECLHKHYSEQEWEEMYDDGNGDSYWTEF